METWFILISEFNCFQVKAQVIREPEVSFADFVQVQSLVEASVKDVQSMGEKVAALKEGDIHM